jgi:sugar O-acyltransferase (sialic acid O-acetyltransferase NeuD family)
VNSLFIYGAGGFGQEVLETAKDMNSREERWSDFYFIDDFNSNRLVNKIPVVDFDFFADNSKHQAYQSIVIAIGDPRSRAKIINRLRTTALESFLTTIISPHARISRISSIGLGSIICAGAHVSVNTEIGQNCVINNNSIVGHDVTIDDDSVISSQVNLGGHVKISQGVFIGMGSLVREGVTIGEGAFIGMGSCVQRDIPKEVLAMGCPARPISKVGEMKLYRN